MQEGCKVYFEMVEKEGKLDRKNISFVQSRERKN